MTDHSKILAFIDRCNNVHELRTVYENAHRCGEKNVADAAFRKLIFMLLKEKPGTLEHDFWQTVYAFEHQLSEERGKTTLLSRTRQKVTRVGELNTLKDWALDTKETEGFKMLLERGMPELTGEAIVLTAMMFS